MGLSQEVAAKSGFDLAKSGLSDVSETQIGDAHDTNNQTTGGRQLENEWHNRHVEGTAPAGKDDAGC